VGVSNGAIQFMAYEKMKKWGFDQKRKKAERTGKTYNQELDKLVWILSNCGGKTNNICSV
jgi:solute carrier family 25 folate transporter 32